MSNPNKPTRLQMKVLKAVHNQAALARVMQDRAQARQKATGQAPPSSWYEDFHGRALLRQQLENAASAAGIPTAWIEQCRQRGDLGARWRADLHWREPEPIDRQQSLADLEQQVRQVQDMAAVAAVYSEIGARAEVGTAQLFDRKLRILAQRVRAIATVLDVSNAEADRLWGGQAWKSAAESVHGLAASDLAARWRAHARADTTDFALQATALGDAGLPLEDGVWARWDPVHMVEEIHTHLAILPHEPNMAPQPGARIAAAIEAAGVDCDVGDSLQPDTTHPAPTPVDVTMPGIEP